MRSSIVHGDGDIPVRAVGGGSCARRAGRNVVVTEAFRVGCCKGDFTAWYGETALLVRWGT
jgi:hypothetical protein